LLLNGSVISCSYTNWLDIQVKEVKKHTERGRPSKDAFPTLLPLMLLELKELRLPSKSNELKIYFMTNVIDTKELSDDDAFA